MLFGFTYASLKEAQSFIPETEEIKVMQLFPFGYATESMSKLDFIQKMKEGRIVVPNAFWEAKGYGPGYIGEGGEVFLYQIDN